MGELTTASDNYVGRFAPSPTGPLHLGSLTTAVASYLHAKSHQGRWRVRMDDLDAPRNEPGASDAILRCLEQHQLLWDGPVIYQSERLQRYRDALAELTHRQLTFYCRCSRRMLDAAKPYPGTCRQHTEPTPNTDSAVRTRCQAQPIEFNDLVAGSQQATLATTCGDFIIWRRDGLPSYQLATATDDGEAEITHVVRGNDLLADTPRQLYLIDALGGQRPAYAHLPVLVDAQSVKLSKRTGARPVDSSRPLHNIAQVLGHLGLKPEANWAQMDCPSLLAWAAGRWQLPSANRPNPAHIS